MVTGRSASDRSVLRKALAIAPSVEVVLEGGSMAPLIASGARATVRACTLDAIRSYDVVVYERAGRVIAHVAARIDADGVHASPLGEEVDPAPIAADELLGRLDGIVLRRRSVALPRTVARAIVALAHRFG